MPVTLSTFSGLVARNVHTTARLVPCSRRLASWPCPYVVDYRRYSTTYPDTGSPLTCSDPIHGDVDTLGQEDMLSARAALAQRLAGR